MNKTRFVNKNRKLFIGHLFAFFIIVVLSLGINLSGKYNILKDNGEKIYIYAGVNYEKCSVEIPVSVSKDYGESYDDEIVIEPLSESNPMPEIGTSNDGKAVVKIKDNNSENIKISFDEPGEYEYKIYENKGSEGTVEYDSRIYHATVFIIDNDGKLDYVLSLKIEGENAKPEKLQFVNIEEEKTTKEETKEETEEYTEENTEDKTEEPTEATESENQDTTKQGDEEDETNYEGKNPTTGDNFPLETVLLIMFTSCALIFALVYIKIRLSKSDDDKE